MENLQIGNWRCLKISKNVSFETSIPDADFVKRVNIYLQLFFPWLKNLVFYAPHHDFRVASFFFGHFFQTTANSKVAASST